MKSQPSQNALKSISKGTWMFISKRWTKYKCIPETEFLQPVPGMNDGKFFYGFICEKCVSFLSFYAPASTFECP